MTTDRITIMWDYSEEDTPVELDYEIRDNHDATNGEFWLNAFGRGERSYLGWQWSWLEAYLSVPRAGIQGTLRNVGMWTHFLRAGKPVEYYSIGCEIEPDYWRTGLTTRLVRQSGYEFPEIRILSFAFFIDVCRGHNDYVRLWQSRQGSNFTLEEAFAANGERQELSHGCVEYARDDGPLFGERARRSWQSSP